MLASDFIRVTRAEPHSGGGRQVTRVNRIVRPFRVQSATPGAASRAARVRP